MCAHNITFVTTIRIVASVYIQKLNITNHQSCQNFSKNSLGNKWFSSFTSWIHFFIFTSNKCIRTILICSNLVILGID